MSGSHFYQDQPLFGLDIGYSSLKVMQLETLPGKQPRVIGYGFSPYPHEAISSGVITKYDALANSLHSLFENHLLGEITTKRVACTVPTASTFSRPMKLPPMSDKDIIEAVKLEAEQYIPVPSANLYIDFDIARKDDNGIELLMVATPKDIIDSHMRFLEAVGLEPVAMEPTMNASSRFFSMADPDHDKPSILIDLGSVAIDLAVLDKTMFVNSTVNGGNDTMTELIAKKLGIDNDQAYLVKNRSGISEGDKQDEIRDALAPILDNLTKEVHRTLRYYNDRVANGERKISQIIVLGGGATMPGLKEFLSEEFSLPVRMLDPWSQINFGDLTPPEDTERPMYVTVAGEALLDPRSILRD